ncbi:Ig-like domain-containing protein [Companilactobacillus farciminis]|uniref:Ig-like domain-containing protein n=1 Tax=Companilactobacillus farciminis TaxID=1612 RepID=UPI00232E7E3D|nr:Ig-like domain-containing protein [Companilactobacillus farciminis]WCG36169.1 Ig-like domain-containing protein [Companilactobacillus farciminis]
MKKLNVKWALLIAMLTFMAACLFSDKIQREVSANEEIPVEDITPYKTPTGDVRKFLGIWMTSGYNLQPQPNNYTVVDSPTTLRTDQGRSFIAFLATALAPARYQWYETTDGKKWTEVSKKNGGTKKNLTVTPKEIGTKYYQQKVEWYIVFSVLSPTVYSKVAAVHALDKHVSATDIEVSVDDDYIYNYSSDITTTSTYAHATVTPANFTGDIKWSIDNEDLATIDEDSGLITANTRTKSGIVTVTATAINNDGTTVSNSAEVTVGGGLEDQTVKAGETAEFKLMGNIGEFEEQEDLNYTIRWFKEDPITHEQSEIEVGKNSVSHTTPKTTLNDDGTLFFAYITVKASGKTYEYTTNEATLHVLPDGGPDITLDDTLENKTYSNTSDNSTNLYDVNKDDEVVFKTDIVNNSSSGQLKNASYNLPLRAGTTIKKVTLDDQELSDTDYEVKTNSDTDELTLVVKNINLGIHKTASLVVDTKVSDVNKRETYRTIGYLVGKDDSGNDVQKISSPRSLNLTTNKLEYTIKDIDYGSIKPIGNDQVIFRQNNESNWPDNVMDVDDMRRDKTPITLSVSQDSDFVSEDSKNTLAGHLKFFDDDYEQDLLTGSAIVSQTKSGQEMTSLSWQADKGILLELDNKQLNASGNYETKLNWVFTDSI